MDSTLLPTGDVRCVGAATEGRGRADEAEAAEGRISWEPPGLSTERMLVVRLELELPELTAAAAAWPGAAGSP